MPRPRPIRRRLGGAALALLGGMAVMTLPGDAASISERTLRVSQSAGGASNGPSASPSLSARGEIVVFDSAASNLVETDANGPVRDVFLLHRPSGGRQLVSTGLDGQPANGASTEPAVSHVGGRVAFTSAASNLVRGDGNGRRDIFTRVGGGPIQRVSVGVGGVEANGDSYDADLSGDGRFVCFTSEASNLVPGDTNNRPDVFRTDLATGRTIRVNLASNGEQAAGRSSTPSISPDGRYVVFESGAPNLVGDDSNGVSDVFLRDATAARTERVSISSNETEQNGSVARGFLHVADVSLDGAAVVFDSDATNLVEGDMNRDTDIFVRDRRRGTTERVSVDAGGVQGDNDSFAPSITPNGRYVVFESFADNLAPGGRPGEEDVLLYDRTVEGATVVNVTSGGGVATREAVPQLLQRPAVSADALVAAFSSTADNLTAGDRNAAEDVFIRLLDRPRGSLVGRPPSSTRVVADPRIVLGADDPRATTFLCRYDGGPQRVCPRGRLAVPRLGGGRHTVEARAGGPGMLFDQRPLEVVFTGDGARPTVRVNSVARGLRRRLVSGRAADRGTGVARVEVAVGQLRARGCQVYDGRRFRSGPCTLTRFIPARGTSRWRLRLRQRPRGVVYVRVRVTDRAGNTRTATRGPVRMR